MPSRRCTRGVWFCRWTTAWSPTRCPIRGGRTSTSCRSRICRPACARRFSASGRSRQVRTTARSKRRTRRSASARWWRSRCRAISGLFWAGTASNEPLSDAQVAALGTLAKRIVERSREPESDDAREDRLGRLESLSDVLPLIARALDLRDVFERLSGIARRALPHDTCVVGIHNEDHTQVRLHALSGGASLVGLPEVVPNPYPKALAVSREFAIIRDLVSHPFEQGGSRRAARPAVGAAAAAVARRTAQGRARLQQRRAGALHRNRSADRAAHRRLHHAGAVAQGDRRTRRSARRRWPSAPPA